MRPESSPTPRRERRRPRAAGLRTLALRVAFDRTERQAWRGLERRRDG